MEISKFFKKVTNSLTRKKTKKEKQNITTNTSVHDNSEFLDISTDSFKIKKSTSPSIPKFISPPIISSDKNIKGFLSNNNRSRHNIDRDTCYSNETGYFTYNSGNSRNSENKLPFNYSNQTISTSPNESVYSQLFDNDNDVHVQHNLNLFSLMEPNYSKASLHSNKKKISQDTLKKNENENLIKLKRNYNRNVALVNPPIRSHSSEYEKTNIKYADISKHCPKSSETLSDHSQNLYNTSLAYEIRKQDMKFVEASHAIYELAKLISPENSLNFPDTKLAPPLEKNSSSVTINEPLLHPFHNVEIVNSECAYPFI